MVTTRPVPGLAGRPRPAARLVRSVAAAYLVLLVLGTPAYWVASFGPGMALADTYAISGADSSPWPAPLYVTSGLALVALAGLLAWAGPRASADRGSTADRGPRS